KQRPLITDSLSEIGDKQNGDSLSNGQIYARETDQEKQYLQKELIDKVLAIVDSESSEENRERNRRIFLLADRDGYTGNEIAELEDIAMKRSGVNSFLNRIKKKLNLLYEIGEVFKEYLRSEEHTSELQSQSN